MKKERIDILLVEKGLAESREKAKRLIMSGIVYIDNEKVDKSGTRVDIEGEILVKGNPLPYVSRGGLKLEKALKEFPISVKDKVALDIGASTGGFSDCMLQNGARKIYAIDVGYGQLDWKVRSNEKVIPMDRTNIRYVTPDDLEELGEFVSIDVSFISLKLVLPVVKELTEENVDIIALIKPQFEAGREKVGKKGVIKDKKVHKEVIRDIYEFCKTIGLNISGLTFSPVKGAEGNREYLAYITKNMSQDNVEDIIDKVVDVSHDAL